MRFLSLILFGLLMGLVSSAWSAPPTTVFPVPARTPTELPAGQGPVVPAAASSTSQLLPPVGGSFPVRLPPVGYPSLPGVPATTPSQSNFPRPVESPRQVFTAAQVIAVVGDQFVLAGDLLPQVEMIVESVLARMSPEQRGREGVKIQQQRDVLLRKILDQTIERKMLYVAFLRSIPEARREEALPMIQQQTEKSFEESMGKTLAKVREAKPSELVALTRQNPQQVRLAKLMVANEAVALGQLDLLLRRYGSSLEQEKRFYAERNLGRSIIGQNIDRNREVTHQQMLDYYREHLPDYEIQAQVRWERLSAHFSKTPDKEAAYRMIAELGNEVLRGAPFSAVAKRRSHGLRAAQGGRYDWTAKGSLRSVQIEEALYKLPLNRLSQIIEDDRGFHIVRILDRREAGHVPFGEVQVKIKGVFQKKHFDEQLSEYIAKLRDDVSVWTIYDGGPGGMTPPNPAAP
ncbi:MAG: peptidylprolyl isomerase [Pirellulaceae bacterium]